MAKEIAREMAKINLALFVGVANELEQYLSEQGKQNLAIVIAYVEQNPEVLAPESGDSESTDGTEEGTTEGWSQEVLDAWADLEEEIAESIQFEEDFGIGDVEQEVVDEIEVGSEYTLQGTLELVADTPAEVEHLYRLKNEEDGNWYYFVFDNESAEEAAGLVGEQVTVTVEITEVLEDKVQFNVVSGPTAV